MFGVDVEEVRGNQCHSQIPGNCFVQVRMRKFPTFSQMISKANDMLLILKTNLFAFDFVWSNKSETFACAPGRTNPRSLLVTLVFA